MQAKCIYCQSSRLSDLMPLIQVLISIMRSLQYGSCHLWLVESPDEIVQKSTDQSGLPRDWFSFIFLFSFSFLLLFFLICLMFLCVRQMSHKGQKTGWRWPTPTFYFCCYSLLFCYITESPTLLFLSTVPRVETQLEYCNVLMFKAGLPFFGLGQHCSPPTPNTTTPDLYGPHDFPHNEIFTGQWFPEKWWGSVNCFSASNFLPLQMALLVVLTVISTGGRLDRSASVTLVRQ